MKQIKPIFKIQFLFSMLFFSANSLAQLFTNEVHISDAGADANERIEIAGPAGTNLTGWSVYFYDGALIGGGTFYSTVPLTGTLPNNCTAGGQNIGTVVVDVVAATGLSFQNGGGPGPDGWALVFNGVVKEFYSYTGTFTATNGPANGMVSVDIGVMEDGLGADTGSIQRTSTNTWVINSSTNTFAACNTSQFFQAPLPVSLISFLGKKTGENENTLNWKTSDEKNFSHFVIERSENAKTFEKIGEVKTNESKIYEYIDRTLSSGSAGLYRLKMLDFDGTSNLSKIIAIENSIDRSNIGQLYPNPSLGKSSVDIIADKVGNWQISTFDLSGKLINSETKFLQKGTNTVNFERLAFGVNYVKFDNGKSIEIRKVLKD